MFEIINGGLFVAAIVGLTTVAYRHPKGYARVYKVLAAIASAYGLLSVGYVVGILLGCAESRSFIETVRLTEANQACLDKIPPSVFSLGVIGLALYLCFLSFLPEILGSDLNKSPDQQNKPD